MIDGKSYLEIAGLTPEIVESFKRAFVEYFKPIINELRRFPNSLVRNKRKKSRIKRNRTTPRPLATKSNNWRRMHGCAMRKNLGKYKRLQVYRLTDSQRDLIAAMKTNGFLN